MLDVEASEGVRRTLGIASAAFRKAWFAVRLPYRNPRTCEPGNLGPALHQAIVS